ncbi:MAG: RNA-guided endonuclease TnpB family protein, partial [Pyrinomonadaceae bacterium]
IGVDLGVVKLATTSDGEHFSGEAVERVRRRYHTRRQTLQHAASRRKAKGKRPKAIRRALLRTKGREADFRRHTNHVISK